MTKKIFTKTITVLCSILMTMAFLTSGCSVASKKDKPAASTEEEKAYYGRRKSQKNRG